MLLSILKYKSIFWGGQVVRTLKIMQALKPLFSYFMVQKSREPAIYFSSRQSRTEGHVRGDCWPYSQPPGICAPKRSGRPWGAEIQGCSRPLHVHSMSALPPAFWWLTQHMDPALINKPAKRGTHRSTKWNDGHKGLKMENTGRYRPQGTNFQIRWTSAADLMYSMMTTVNTILLTRAILREQILGILATLTRNKWSGGCVSSASLWSSFHRERVYENFTLSTLNMCNFYLSFTF